MQKKFQLFSFILFLIISMIDPTITHAACATNQTQVVKAFNQFAFDLNKKTSATKENSILSPYSLSSLLTILSSGASGNTQLQLIKTLQLKDQPLCSLNKDLDEINSALQFAKPCAGFSCKIRTLASNLGLTTPQASFVIANAIWAKKGLNYQPTFVNQLQLNHTATFYAVDFVNEPEQARQTINDWVTKKTNGKINELIGKGMISSSTQLVLTNAIYFKGIWQSPFKVANTQQQPFTLENGTQSSVMMMHQTKHFLYTENNLLQLLQLPYSEGHLMLGIILPKKNISLKQIQRSLNASSFLQLLANSSDTNVDVSLPRFHLAANMNLSNALQNLGIKDAFSSKANFTDISMQPLQLSIIIQNAIIDVDEAGTTAAAATATVMVGSAAVLSEPKKPVIFNANHPFLFYIFDSKTGLILFMGQVTQP